MATRQINTIIQHLRRAALLQDRTEMTDGQLLESFVAKREEAAFESLLRRHGPMVLGVCYRILRNHHDAEDAFQATFLVFARKASSVRPRDRVANWLHGVAHRTALKARTLKAKTQVRERQVTQMPEPEAVQQDQWNDLQPLLDEELARLPETYRLPLLLCDLEGKSIKAATQQLGWPQGTLASRLVRARKMLAKRLTQRGVMLSGGSLAMVLTEKAALACVAPSLAVSTIKAAVAIAAGQAAATGAISAKVAALTEGVLKAMFLTKLKTVMTVLLVLGTVAFGGGLLSRQTAAGQQIQAGRDGEKPANRPAVPPKKADARNAASETEKVHRVTYPVADLVVPIRGLDFLASSNKTEEGRTREEWLIKKITRTVSPESWKTGTIEYFPLGKALVVNNTARVQSQVKYLLETMRRVQEVEVVAETHILSLNEETCGKLQGLLPQLKKDGHVVLGEVETFALLRKAQDDTATKLVQAPRVTFFPGQRVSFSMDPIKEFAGIGRIDIRLTALVAANLQHIDLDVKATVGKVEFTKAVRLVDGVTLAQLKRNGEDYLMFLVTPLVILNLQEEIDTHTPAADSSRATRSKQSSMR